MGWIHYHNTHIMTHDNLECLSIEPDRVEFTSDGIRQSEHFNGFSNPLPASTQAVEETLQGKLASCIDFGSILYGHRRKY